MKKIIIILIISGLFLYGILTPAPRTIISLTLDNKFLDSRTEEDLCDNVVSYCHGTYNVLCAMSEPLIGEYRVSSLVCEERGSRNHKAIDLVRLTENTQVKAVLGGIVETVVIYPHNCVPQGAELSCSQASGCQSAAGTYINILVTDSHFENYHVIYMHLAEVYVKQGDVVGSGTVIGKIGNTGCSTGEHLHVQVMNPDNKPVNTTPFFTNKSSYSCGSLINEGTNNGPQLGSIEFEPSGVLKDANGNEYKAKVGNCPGSNGTEFIEGVELLSNGTPAEVYAMEGGTVGAMPNSECGTGAIIIGVDGNVYTYCHLESGSFPRLPGDIIAKGDFIGVMGKTGNATEVGVKISVQKEGKLVDASKEFLNSYGGKCKNEQRTNCNAITDDVAKNACNGLFGTGG